MTSGESAQYLSFFVGGDEYGLALLEAREILQAPQISTVPSQSRFMRGITNMRGRVLPVVDMAVVLGHEVKAVDKWSCVVVVELSGDVTTTVGLLVDAIHRVFDLRAEHMLPPPELGTRGRVQFVRGVTTASGPLVRVLDLSRVIEQADVDEALATPTNESEESHDQLP